jgi:hypothetical protein
MFNFIDLVSKIHLSKGRKNMYIKNMCWKMVEMVVFGK